MVLERENMDANEHERLYTQKQIDTCSVLVWSSIMNIAHNKIEFEIATSLQLGDTL